MNPAGINFRSLRVRLCLWYVLLSGVSVSALGCFSYVYLDHALASSRQHTLERREVRLQRFLAMEGALTPTAPLAEHVRHYMQANPDTDRLEIFDLHGKALYPERSEGTLFAWPAGRCDQPCFRHVEAEGHTFRLLQHNLSIGGQPVRVTLAGRTDENHDILRAVKTSFLIFLPLFLLASIGGGFVLSHRALEPVDRITRAACSMGLSSLDHRLPVPRTGDELERLAETWNALLDRLESAVTNLRQFTGDISHDLRTSITVMLSTSQLALRRERSLDFYRNSLDTIRSECEATSTLLDDLVAASRTEIQPKLLKLEPVDLQALVRDSCAQLQARAEMKRQWLHVETPTAAWTEGDSSLLRRLVHILLDNALKYTDGGGTITARVWCCGAETGLEVTDTGIGIEEQAIHRIFHRAFRVDVSRNRDGGGNGLGLAIAKWIAEAHHTQIKVVSAAGRGSTFSIPFRLLAYDPLEDRSSTG